MSNATLSTRVAVRFDTERFAASKAVSVGIAILAIGQQAVGHLNGDVSWFITFAEQVLGGARAYVDVSDPNPPAAFLLYMPAAIVAAATGMRVEAATVAELLGLVAASLLFTARILRPVLAERPEDAGLLRNAALWVLLVAPGFGFAEREHAALLFVLPLLAVFAMRAEGRTVAVPLASIAGAVGGLALAFKPHYGLAIGFAATAMACARRSPKLLFTPELCAVAGVAALYGLTIFLRFPNYVTDVLPLALEVYAPARNSLLTVVVTPLFAANVALLAIVTVFARRVGAQPRVFVVVAGSVGFLVTFVLQAKGWFNHAYPGLALAVLAAVVLYVERRDRSEAIARFGRLCVVPALVCLPFFAAVTMNLPGAEEHPGLTAAVRAVAPANPRVAALAEQLDFGHPLVRQVDGTWVGRQNALWITNCVDRILATTDRDDARRAKLLGYARQDREAFAADVAAGRPDVLVVENAGLRRWAEGQPELAGVFSAYRHVADAGDVEVWAHEPQR